MALLRDLRTEFDMAVVLITHDLALVAEEADRVAVMYAGNIVETGPVAEVFADPQAPLHQGPARLGARQRGPRRRPEVDRRVAAGPARHPDGLRLPGPLPAGPRHLRHHPPAARDRRHAGRKAACHFPEEVAQCLTTHRTASCSRSATCRKTFRVPGAGKNQADARWTASTSTWPAARRSGLVGESGCGKSTLARTLMMLERPDSGTVTLRRHRPVQRCAARTC